MARRRWWRTAWMTEAEYGANINGLNIFFGAVLGVVMSRAESLGQSSFAVALFLVASLVISILYVSSARRRWLYAAFTAVMIYFLPWIAQTAKSGLSLPPNLQTTLAVWLALVLLVELSPREQAAERADGRDEGS